MDEQKYQEIIKALKKQDERLQRMENGLFGDSDAGSIGFVNRFEATEQQSKTNTKRIDKIYIVTSTIAFIVSMIFHGVVFLLQ